MPILPSKNYEDMAHVVHVRHYDRSYGSNVWTVCEIRFSNGCIYDSDELIPTKKFPTCLACLSG